MPEASRRKSHWDHPRAADDGGIAFAVMQTLVVPALPLFRREFGASQADTTSIITGRLRAGEHGRCRAARHTGRWVRYEDVPAAADVAPVLAEIDADPDGVFWG